MEEENQNNKENVAATNASEVAVTSVDTDAVAGAVNPGKKEADKNRFGKQFGQRGTRPFARRGGKSFQQKNDLDNKILSIRRVTRVIAGGKRFNFSVYIVVGDKKGSVGVGTGKAGDTSQAIDKAVKNGRKNMIKVKLTPSMSIPCETSAKYCSAVVSLKPAEGKGLVAGSSVRDVLVLGGIKDINAKILSRSKNKINNARATVLALQQLNSLCNYTK